MVDNVIKRMNIIKRTYKELDNKHENLKNIYIHEYKCMKYSKKLIEIRHMLKF